MIRFTNPAYIRAAIMVNESRRKIMGNLVDIFRVEKSWGYEKWFANQPNYCGKEIFIKRGHMSSYGRYHYHKIKDETFYSIKGNLILDYVDEKNIFYNIRLFPGSAFRIKPGIKHRFSTITLGGCKFIEASTHHEEEDSYRCFYDKETGKWVDV